MRTLKVGRFQFGEIVHRIGEWMKGKWPTLTGVVLVLAIGCGVLCLFAASDDRVKYESITDAVKYGDTADVRRHLRLGADVQARYERDNSLLHIAATTGHTGCAQELLKAGAIVNAKNDSGTTPLHLAAGWGHAELAGALIAAGANMDFTTHEGETPLYIAARNGRMSTVRLLLDRGADIHAETFGRLTPLHGSALYANTAVGRTLIEHGADVNHQDVWGYTPLHLATTGFHKTGKFAAVEKMLASSTTVAERNGFVELLLEHGANPNAVNDAGETPWQLVAEAGHEGTASLLRRHGTVDEE